MNTDTSPFKKATRRVLLIAVFSIFLILIVLVASTRLFSLSYDSSGDANAVEVKGEQETIEVVKPKPVLDTVLYDQKMLELANIPPPPPPKPAVTTGTTTGTTTASAATVPPPPKPQLWPVNGPYPKAGAILPFNRIIAYYGNFYSTKMGVLGEYPTDEMLRRLDLEVKKWEAADPTTPVIPAIDYIAVTAQGTPSVGGKYRLRMPPAEIDKAVALANRINGIVILEIQSGQSTMEAEIPMLEAYLKLPNVHLALDPEFTMLGGAKPGSVIGTIDAKTINFASEYLANLVQRHDLPPKILLVHRFTRPMVTNYKSIKLIPEVQIIMDMDGWGPPEKKFGTYKSVIVPEPVQFTGFKLFYKNDLFAPSTRMLTPEELLKLSPRPSFIQFQ